MKAMKSVLHSAVQVCSESLICPIIEEITKKVFHCCKRIPEAAAVGTTKDEYLQVKSALLEVRQKAIAFGFQSTDVKKVYEKTWIQFSTEKSAKKEKYFSLQFPSIRKMSLIIGYCLLLFIAIFTQNYSHLSSSRCLVLNNYFLMEITRPVISCDFCKNVNSVIVLDNPSKEDFAVFAYSAKPILVKHATYNWTAFDVFSFNYFKQIYSEVKDGYRSIEEECQFFPFRTNFIRLSEVFSLPEDSVNATHATEDPWYIVLLPYLFTQPNTNESKLHKSVISLESTTNSVESNSLNRSNCNPDIASRLRAHYTRPAFLPHDSESSAIDWIFMGYAGRGSSLHLDYVQRPSWQAQISGSKRWRLMPSPECESQCNEFEVTVNEGDIILIDTNKWYHDTLVKPGKISITIGSEYD
ncbi:F-box protein-like protein [Leptotrombidium deliense]|uniref:F-box protein-like protein n=1 Tax=Leptotrombidium deliense TaxID=299467 RepID=A0A443SV42_9ACAR|nr:F-box protein-like protein [Leptotrombidium deliense]